MFVVFCDYRFILTCALMALTMIFFKPNLSGIYTTWPKKSGHLDLPKQIDKSLLLDNYCMGDYLSAGKLFNPN